MDREEVENTRPQEITKNIFSQHYQVILVMRKIRESQTVIGLFGHLMYFRTIQYHKIL